jgi:serine/threonine-protein phosphatase PGAM5
MNPRVRRVVTACALAFALVSDGLAPRTHAAENPSGDGIHTLYLIRHGDYESDDPRDSDAGKALNPLGKEQARLVGQRLAALPVPFDALYASSMRRARETAEIVSGILELPVRPATDIRECTPPARRADVRAKSDPQQATACREQLEGAFAHYFQPSPERDSREILVCHGNVIRYLVCRTLGVDPEAWDGMTIANCSITVIEVRADGSQRLVSFDDVGHLPPDKQTYTGTRRPQPATAR